MAALHRLAVLAYCLRRRVSPLGLALRVFLGVHGRPRLAKRSIRNSVKVKIAPVHSDFVCDALSRSLMGCAGWRPIALAHFTCQPNSGLHQPRSYLLRHHCMIACAIGGINNLVLPLLCAGPITQRRNRIGNSCRVLTVPTQSVHSCSPVPLLPRSCCVVPAVCLANCAHWPCVQPAG
jgi:hypothetical protein